MRRLIGHRPLLMVGAAALTVDQENRLLLLKRADSGCWDPPGGAAEPGEVVETAARREALPRACRRVHEETGLELEELSLFGVFSGPELFYRYPNGDEAYNVTIVYLSHRWRGEVRLSGEHSEWRYFPAQEIPGAISPPIRPAIERFVQTYG